MCQWYGPSRGSCTCWGFDSLPVVVDGSLTMFEVQQRKGEGQWSGGS